MRYIILEDEKLASNRLKKLITDLRPDYNCLVTIDAVDAAVVSLPPLRPDLIFMDIQLADGLSFDIFDQIKLEVPIIFTTAYDEYALKAFKQNSIDYLLKPIDPEELKSALDKFEKVRLKKPVSSEEPSKKMNQLVKAMNPKGKERFVVKVGEHLKSVLTKDVQLVYSQDKGTYLFTNDHRRFLVDYTMDKVEELLNPNDFYRISRKFLVNINFIQDMVAFTNSRLEIKVEGYTDDQVIVARERVGDFKDWLDR